MFEVILVPDNPMVATAYPPRLIVEAEIEEQISQWFKEAQEQGQYQSCHLCSVKKLTA